MRMAVGGLALLALAGCGAERQQALEARLGELVGISEAELVRRAGVPARVHEAGERRFLAYAEHWQDIAYVPWGRYGAGRFGDGMGFGSFQYVDRHCEATFEVAGGVVSGVALRGTICGWSDWPVILPP